MKLDLPELPLSDTSHRVLELYVEEFDRWDRWKIDRFSVDGRVRMLRDDESGLAELFDLSKRRRRWVLSQGS